jgi:hypothetical protein
MAFMKSLMVRRSQFFRAATSFTWSRQLSCWRSGFCPQVSHALAHVASQGERIDLRARHQVRPMKETITLGDPCRMNETRP